MQRLEDHPFVRPALAGLLLVVGIGLLGFLLVGLGKDLALWVLGEHVRAMVVDQWAEEVSDDDRAEMTFRYYVRYRFITPRGQVVTTVKQVAVQEWAGVGFGAQGRASVDYYDGTARGPAAPVYREQEHLTEFNAGSMAEAATIDIVYFPLYPAHNRLEESRFIPLLACLYVPLLAMGGAALAAARSLLRPVQATVRPSLAQWAAQRGANQ